MAEEWALREFAGARVAHKMHVEALANLAESLAAAPEVSFSNAVGHGGRQAARRIFRNALTTPEAMLQGHYAQTAARSAGEELLLVVQDTTTFNYSSHHATAGLGPIDEHAGSRGLLCHSALAISAAGQPLGLLAVQIWARDPQEHGKAQKRRQLPTSDKESQKWLNTLKSVQERLPSKQRVLVIQDREADVFAFLAAARRTGVDLLVRASHPRLVELPSEESQTESETAVAKDLLSTASSAPVVAEMRVSVPRKPGQAQREAILTVRAQRLRVKPPRNGLKQPGWKPQELTVINACEENAANPKDGIHWVLLTSLAVTTAEEACQAVQYYSRRWIIERLHFTLKSGYRTERLQIDEASALGNALSLYYLVAWRILWMTYLARTEPETPVEVILHADEIAVLEAQTKRNITTVSEAVISIASLAGYVRYKSAPPPGPKMLWQGLRKLEAMTIGWNLAQANDKT